ncbi:MAG: hypothetical protein AVDCRST_MAG21-892, partial [uncultured Nocardioidaceae bacterium]
ERHERRHDRLGGVAQGACQPRAHRDAQRAAGGAAGCAGAVRLPADGALLLWVLRGLGLPASGLLRDLGGLGAGLGTSHRAGGPAPSALSTARQGEPAAAREPVRHRRRRSAGHCHHRRGDPGPGLHLRPDDCPGDRRHPGCSAGVVVARASAAAAFAYQPGL